MVIDEEEIRSFRCNFFYAIADSVHRISISDNEQINFSIRVERFVVLKRNNDILRIEIFISFEQRFFIYANGIFSKSAHSEAQSYFAADAVGIWINMCADHDIFGFIGQELKSLSDV